MVRVDSVVLRATEGERLLRAEGAPAKTRDSRLADLFRGPARDEAPLDGVLSRVVGAIEGVLPRQDSIPGRAIQAFAGVYDWVRIVGDPAGNSLKETARVTGDLLARVSATAVGLYTTVPLAGLGFALAGPAGLVAVTGVGIGGTYLFSQFASAALGKGFEFLERAFAGPIRE